MKGRVVLVHMGGNENVRSTLNGLVDRQMLHTYITSMAVFKSKWYYKLLNIDFLKVFKRREYSEKIKNSTAIYPLKFLGRMLAEKMKLDIFTRDENCFLSVDAERRYIDKVASRYIQKYHSSISCIYGYEDMACETFAKAKRFRNIKCIYEEPTGYWRCKERLLSIEKEKNPEWARTIIGLRDSRVKLERKDQEIRLADAIIVASTFTKNTLSEYPGELPPIHVIPYGFPVVKRNREYLSFDNRKIRALYVGTLYQQKGLSYMFEAFEDYKDNIELSVIGTGYNEDCDCLRMSLSHVNYLGRMTHDKLLEYMSTQDLLVFPSLFDGFGLVVTEAMSQGTPCIASTCSCGPDIITDRYDGWVVEAGGSGPIKKVLREIVEDPSILRTMGKRAMVKADSRPWSKYEEEIVNTIETIITN